MNPVFFFLYSAVASFLYLNPIQAVFLQVTLLLHLRNGLGSLFKSITFYETLFFCHILNILVGGRKYVYIGVKPIYISEIMLGFTLFLIFSRVLLSGNKKIDIKELTIFSFFLLIYAYSLRCAILYIENGIDTLRDSVSIVYSFWGLMFYHILKKRNLLIVYKIVQIATYSVVFNYLYKLFSFILFKELPQFEGFRFSSGYILPVVYIFIKIVLANKNRWYHNFIFFVLTLNIITLMHRSVYLGAFLGLTIVFLLSGKKVRLKITVYGLSVVAVAVPFLFFFYLSLGYSPVDLNRFIKKKATGSGGNVSYRFKAWDIAYQKFLSNPLFGIGVGKPIMYEMNNRFFVNTTLDYFTIHEMGGNSFVHNSQLNFLVRFGLFGYAFIAIIYLILIFKVIVVLLYGSVRKKRYAVLSLALFAHMFVYSFFNVVIEGPHDGILYWLTIGFLMYVSQFEIMEKSKHG